MSRRQVSAHLCLQALVNVQLLGKYPPFKQLLDIPFTNAILVSILPGAPPCFAGNLCAFVPVVTNAVAERPHMHLFTTI